MTMSTRCPWSRLLCAAVLTAAPVWSSAGPAKIAACSVSFDAYLKDMAEAFALKTGTTPAELIRSGVPVSIAAALNKKSDFGCGCRHITPEEKDRGAVETEVGYDMLVIMVHPSNPVEGLTLDQVRGIFSGKITDWGLVGGVKGRPVVLVGRESKGAGVTVSFEQMVMKGEPLSQKRLSLAHSGDIEREMEANPYGVAISGLSARKRRVKLLKLEGAPPDSAHFRDGTYPLARPLFMVTKGLPQGRAKDFLDFILSPEGQAVLARNAYTLEDWKERGRALTGGR